MTTARGASLSSFADGAHTDVAAVPPDAAFAASYCPEQPAVTAALRPAGPLSPHRLSAAAPCQFAAAAVSDYARPAVPWPVPSLA